MLKIQSKPREGLTVQHQGDPIEIAAEIAMAVSTIYHAFSGESRLIAELFKASIQAAVSDDSPTWGPVNGVTTVKIDTEAMRDA